jgi:hypothetical protein
VVTELRVCVCNRFLQFVQVDAQQKAQVAVVASHHGHNQQYIQKIQQKDQEGAVLSHHNAVLSHQNAELGHLYQQALFDLHRSREETANMHQHCHLLYGQLNKV